MSEKTIDKEASTTMGRRRLTWSREAATGLYGYTKSVQRSVEGATRKLARTALKVARRAFARDAEVVPFLQAHAKREGSRSAKVLLAAMREIGPRVASELHGGMPKEAGAPEYGLYGFKARTADIGLDACKDVRASAGRITADLHHRKGDLHEKITGFLKEHGKQARCAYSGMLLSCYPDPSVKVASEKEAGGGAGVRVLLSGKSREWRLPDHLRVGDDDLRVLPEGRADGFAKVNNLGLASYEDFAFIRDPGKIEDIELNPSEWRAFRAGTLAVATENGFAEGDVTFSVVLNDIDDITLSAGFTRAKAPSDFDVEGRAMVTASWGDISQTEEEIGFTANFSTSDDFRNAWGSLDSTDWPEGDPKRFASGGWIEWED